MHAYSKLNHTLFYINVDYILYYTCIYTMYFTIIMITFGYGFIAYTYETMLYSNIPSVIWWLSSVQLFWNIIKYIFWRAHILSYAVTVMTGHQHHVCTSVHILFHYIQCIEFHKTCSSWACRIPNSSRWTSSLSCAMKSCWNLVLLPSAPELKLKLRQLWWVE